MPAGQMELPVNIKRDYIRVLDSIARHLDEPKVHTLGQVKDDYRTFLGSWTQIQAMAKEVEKIKVFELLLEALDPAESMDARVRFARTFAQIVQRDQHRIDPELNRLLILLSVHRDEWLMNSQTFRPVAAEA